MGNYWSKSTVIYRKYGWRRDQPDRRDKKITFDGSDCAKYIDKYKCDLRKSCPDIYTQGKLGSCTANAIAFAYQYDEMKQENSDSFKPSRLFIYYNERDMEGTTGYDSGAEIRDGVKSINTQGVCSEIIWPYDIAQFTVKPTENCYTNAKIHHTLTYSRVAQTVSQLKGALLTGYPVVFGFVVYTSFESEETAKTGIVTMPKDDEKILGGHAVALVGFDDKEKRFIVRNSWGDQWGDSGYCYMPYQFIADPNYASDFWVVEKVTPK